MKHLNNNDLQILLAAVAELNADFDPKTLAERALSAASKIIAADSVTFTGFDSQGEYAGLLWDTGKISPEEMEIFAAHMYENPLVGAYVIERRPEVLTATDLIRREEYEKTTVYNEFYKQVGVESQLVAPLPISDELFMSCSVNTGRSNFPERDRLLLTLFAPHLVNAIRSAFAYQRLDAALEIEARGIVAVDSKGKPVFVSEFARRLFDKYLPGEKRKANSLPETVASWIKQTNLIAKANKFTLPVEPLKITNQKGELIVRLTYNEPSREIILLLEEKRFATPKLFEQLNMTKREAEMLFWITQGKSDEVIARLCGISPRTVHKHVENIYTKLGVETRTAAMLRALENI